MADLITRTARLVPYSKRPKQVASFVTAYSYEPLADQFGSELGNLYVIMEVLVSGRASEEVADLIIETIGEHYYNQPHHQPEPLHRFENAIKAVNQELGEYVNRGNAAWIGKLSAIISIQAGSELHIAQTGSAEAFLYRGKSHTRISNPEPNRPATPTKTFGSIASGELEAGDRLLLATPALVHQVSLGKLQSLITESGPNSAISEITHLLHGAATDRIAALIIEVTTPELAALQVRSDEPSEIELGVPENPIEVAKLVAMPLAQNTVASSKKIATAAHSGWKHAKPRAQTIGFAIAAKIRRILGAKYGRQIALLTLLVVCILCGGLIWQQQQAGLKAKLFAHYQSIYSDFKQAQTLADKGQKSSARESLLHAQADLKSLSAQSQSLNEQLQRISLPESEPRTVGALAQAIAAEIDKIDGLVKINPSAIATITTKSSQLRFEFHNGSAYIFDDDSGKLSIVNTSTGAIHDLTSGLTRLGKIKATTLSASNDGIYILTDKPSVWFLKFDTNALTEQTINFGSWPQSTAIASYASNLYLLGDTTIYKHLKNATGFSPKVDYFGSNGSGPSNGTALAVDGTVYAVTPSGLHSYIAGAAKQTLAVPQALGQISNLRSSESGQVLIGIAPVSRRVAVWRVDGGGNITFNQQLAPIGIKSLSDALYDPKSGNVYALADGKLIRFPLQPQN